MSFKFKKLGLFFSLIVFFISFQNVSASEFNFYQKEALKGKAEFQYLFGLEIELGPFEIPKREHKAFIWYKKAAEQGHLEAIYKLALMYEKQGLFKQAVSWYERAVEQNHSDASYKLANLYKLGLGVPQNMERAVSLYKQSAEKAHPEALFQLATLYEVGDKVISKNLKEAVLLYKRATEQGHFESAYRLAWIYEWGGLQAPQNFKEALVWYERASSLGSSKAGNQLGKIYEYGREGIPKNLKKAVYWYKLAMMQGSTEAEIRLQSIRFQTELNLQKEQSLENYKIEMLELREIKDSEVLYNIALKYEDKLRRGLPIDFTKVLEIFKYSADLGNVEAQYHLAWIYELGKGIPQDFSEAISWYERAVEQNHFGAKYRLKKLREKMNSLSNRSSTKSSQNESEAVCRFSFIK